MHIKKRFDIQQEFTIPIIDSSVSPTKNIFGQLVAIDLIPETNFFICLDEFSEDEKYCLADMTYGILISRGSGYNDAINTGITILKKNAHRWDEIVQNWLDTLSSKRKDYSIPFNTF